MIERELYIKLYDIYKELLTEKQKEYFESYYFEDLSLSEIAENIGVSKTIIAKTIKQVEEKLINYENLLCMNKLYESIEIIKEKTTDKNTEKELEDLLN